MQQWNFCSCVAKSGWRVARFFSLSEISLITGRENPREIFLATANTWGTSIIKFFFPRGITYDPIKKKYPIIQTTTNCLTTISFIYYLRSVTKFVPFYEPIWIISRECNIKRKVHKIFKAKQFSTPLCLPATFSKI